MLRNVNSPSLLKVALLALELPAKAIAPPLVNEVKLPAVALFAKTICPEPGVKFCTIPELLVMPLPLMVTVGAWLMSVNGLAPALNTIPFTSVSAEKNTFFVAENANVAVSVAPLGIVAGVQFAAVFHVPEPGFVFQVALPAKAAVATKNRSITTPQCTLPLNSLGTAGGGEARPRDMVVITTFVRDFRFMGGGSNEISSGRGLSRGLRLAINEIIHDDDIAGGRFQDPIARGNADEKNVSSVKFDTHERQASTRRRSRKYVLA